MDQTLASDRTFLSFQLAMRDHISHKPSVVLVRQADKETLLRLQSPTYTLVAYTVASAAITRVLLRGCSSQGPPAAQESNGALVVEQGDADTGSPPPLAATLAEHLRSAQDELPPTATRDLRFREVRAAPAVVCRGPGFTGPRLSAAARRGSTARDVPTSTRPSA